MGSPTSDDTLTVEIAKLDGSQVALQLAATTTALDLKRRLALEEGSSTADFRLLWKDAFLRNEQLLCSLEDSAPVLSVLRGRSGRVTEKVGFLASQAESLEDVLRQLKDQLEEEQIETGQVLWIDLHCDRFFHLCAYVSRELPGRGQLNLGWDIIDTNKLSEGFVSALDFAKGREVISVTASSQSNWRGVLMVVFRYEGEVTPAQHLDFVSVEAEAWDWAAAKVVLEINNLNLEYGQLLGIDAHNTHPDAPAMFGAVYSRDLPGHGPLYVDWFSLNQNRGWTYFHAAGCTNSSGKEVISITGSSNCEGRSVQYVFWQVTGVPDYVEAQGSSWEAAGKELLEKLKACGVEAGQVLAIDAHNEDLDGPAVLLAVFKRSLPSRGPLALRCEVLRGRSWNELYRQADQVASDTELVACTGSSGRSLALLLFLGSQRSTPLEVQHVKASAASWNGAAEQLLTRLREANVLRGQLMSLDAHNEGPTEVARFVAQYSRSLVGHGELRLQYRCLNVAQPWPSIHKQAAVRAAPDASVMITGSSNENLRRVMYNFYDYDTT